MAPTRQVAGEIYTPYPVARSLNKLPNKHWLEIIGIRGFHPTVIGGN